MGEEGRILTDFDKLHAAGQDEGKLPLGLIPWLDLVRLPLLAQPGFSRL